MSALPAIGKYRVERELGRGATGAVYLAEDPFNKRKVAIKVMFIDRINDAQDGEHYRTMFLNEAALAGKIIHPHVVSIFDAVVDDNISYIVMEYIEGGTLEPHCKPGHLLEVRQITEIIFKCVRALAFVNHEGLIHRDLKPGNILYRGGTDIKVADFGASLSRRNRNSEEGAVGSPFFMSPEFINSGEASVQSDIYALGMIMYLLLTGHMPFNASSIEGLRWQIANHVLEPVSSRRQGVPLAVEAVVEKATAKDVAKRYATWEQFGEDLSGLWPEERAQQQAKGEVSDTAQFGLLKKLSFFRDFPENELWEVLRISQGRAFRPDTALIREGESGDSFFIIAQGMVKVTRGTRVLNMLGAGDCIGEMAYLTHRASPRSATVTTASECIIFKIRAADLNAASPSCRQLFDRKFLETLVERLSTANEQLASG